DSTHYLGSTYSLYNLSAPTDRITKPLTPSTNLMFLQNKSIELSTALPLYNLSLSIPYKLKFKA
ncbi:hypothetical protein, partial [Flagellimonas olearia]|uniref:hypothetical protein n=1 Tax=Flagellimonas olearia TaxID=552546 RepID=UPI001B86AB94